MPNRLPDDTRTLTRHDYLSDEVYEIERARIFDFGADAIYAGQPR